MIEMSIALATAELPTTAMPFLVANGKTLSTMPNRLGWLTPTAGDTPVKKVKELYAEHGYVWLKRFLDPTDVLAFRGYVFRHLAGTGLIAPDADPRLGISGTGPVRKDLADRRLMALVRSTTYEGFCVQPRLSRFMDEFLEGLSYLHKRKIMRYTQPHTPTVTPAHYDLIYLRGGTTRVVTSWIPIGDVPAAMGGLVYLEGSHAIGVEMEREFSRHAANLTPEEKINAYNKNMTEGGWVSKDLPDMADRFNARWLGADYEAGDVMLHSPYMIHASTTNEDAENRVRLSTDIRFQNVDDEIDARWSNHWSLDDML
jgi:ectoine hydroxylase-related dioxygenase (phytanoyl-CoA dioxygenase family)